MEIRKAVKSTRVRKIRLFLFVVLLFVVVIAGRLFFLQVGQNQRFEMLRKKNFLRVEKIPSMRGNVLDCNGHLLATNRPSFDLYWNGSGRFRLSAVQKKFLKKAKSIVGTQIIDEAVERRVFRAERFSRNFLLKKEITQDELCKISEQCGESSNLLLDRHFKRVYPYGSLASHILGYIRGNEGDSLCGLYGLERKFQDDLQGEFGFVEHVINATGKKLFRTQSRPAISGNDIQLTLDLTMQSIAEILFSPGQAGAFIIMDPEDGSVRVMLSYPRFDPNMFLGSISEREWKEHFSFDSPLLNRAIHATYPPASIFKLVTFVAGFEEGIIDVDTEFTCKGYTIFGGRKYNCQRRWGHGIQTTKKAFGVSCNIPCYDIAQKITIDRLAAYAMRFGLGQSTNFLFRDKKGLVPTSYWKQAYLRERWWSGETLSVSIGQSFLLVTPLQVVRMVASICSGYLVKPRILVNEEVERYPLYVSEGTLDFLRDVMKEVVQSGTARWLKDFTDFSIWAKTGTAQIISLQKQMRGAKKQLEHAWFASFFSYKNEKPLAMAVLVENAGSSRPALKIAKNFFTIYKQVLGSKHA
jgi:penicillin-binding protein 2